MALFVFSLLLVLAGIAVIVFGRHLHRFAVLAGIGLVVVAVLILLFSTVRVIPANTVSVPTTFGKVGAPLHSGVHLVAPWTETNDFSLREQNLSMLRDPSDGDRETDDSIDVIAKGGGSMKVDITVRFKLDASQVAELYRRYQSIDAIKESVVRSETREATRNVIGDFTAEEAYSTKRAQISAELSTELEGRLAKNGLVLVAVNVRDVLPEQKVLDSINAILAARNEAAKAKEEQTKQVTEAETRRQVAEKDAEAKKVAAQGDADAARIAADAEAYANDKVSASLTPELLQKLIAEQCASAIAASKAQVINVCPGSTGAGGAGSGGGTTVVLDARTPATTP